jgi:hypothetical protein
MEKDCVVCGLPNEPIGSLGKLAHYTCRGCGCWYSGDMEETEPAPIRCGARFKRTSILGPSAFSLTLTCGQCGALCDTCERTAASR